MKTAEAVATILAVSGALNWGLIAIARFDLVAALLGMRFGEVSAFSEVLYGVVGLSGVYLAIARLTAPRPFVVARVRSRRSPAARR